METEILLPELTCEATIETLEVQAGDVLVFSTENIPSGNRIASLKDEVEKLLPGVKVLVLTDGLHFERVLRLTSNEG